MKLTAYITKVSTGEVREEVQEIQDKYGHNQRWQWTEGNYGCDCNRGLFWAVAGGEDDLKVSCGETKFRVRVVLGNDEILNEGAS